VITLTLMMMVPLILLYEFSIFLSRLVQRRRVAEAAREAAAEA
jgi:sec-independent protein translocase protein TatC